MASDPNAAPESIVLGQFSGIRNTVAPERLAQGEFAAAVNVDLDDSGQLRRRRGFDRKDDANYHSLRRFDDRTFVVKNGTLGLLGADYSHTPLVAVGIDHLGYTAVGEAIYFSSRSTSGKIVGGVPLPWGQSGGPGRWLSPVIRPTETLGAIRGKLVGAPPLADILEYYNGRIYLASERWLWVTELYLYDIVDKTKNFMQFEHDITMVQAVGDGCYVGTTQQLFFLSGTHAQGMKRMPVADCAVIKGSAVQVPTAAVHPAARTQPVPENTSPVFMTADGICLGLEGGQVYNLTRGRVVFPAAVNAAALYREDQGANSYVAVTDSAGGPTANARIGDYVDAEIIRASQGG